MKRIILIALAIILMACSTAPAQVTATPQVTATLLPPTQTPAPTATESPAPSPEVQEKFDKAGIDIEKMENAKIDKDGLHITIEGREEVIVPTADFERSIFVKRDGTLQILDKDGKDIIYAFDMVNNEFAQKSDWVYFPEDKKVDKAVLKRVAAEDKLEQYRMEKLFFKEFPEDVFQPDPDRINNQVGSVNIFKDQNPDGKYPASMPYGPGANEMFRLENIFIVEKDPANGRPYDTVYITQSIAINGQLGTMHFVYDISSEQVMGVVQDLVSASYIIPINGGDKSSYNLPHRTTSRLASEENGLQLNEDNGIYYFQFDEFLIQSFKTGVISPYLTDIEMTGIPG